MDLGFLKTFRRLLVLGILMGVFLASLLSVTHPARAATGTNQTINFQGRLLTSSGAAVPDGYYNIQFKVYQDGDGASVGDTTGSPTGTLKWTENYLNVNSQGVRVFNGYMSVSLGSVNPFGSSVDWNQNTLWLSMNIGNTNVSCASFAVCSPDGEMTPMQPLTSAVYALNSNQLGGLTAAAFGQLAASQTFVGANIFQPTTNVTGVKVIQSSAGAPTADIFNVQSANNTNLIQVTGPSANNAAITLHSLGAGNAITLNSTGALSFTGAAASVWDIGNNTLSLQTTNNGAITTGSGLLTVGGSQTFSGANPTISTSTTNTNMTIQTNGTGTLTLNTTGAGTVNVGTTNTTTVGIGNNTSGTVDTITGGATALTIANGGATVKTSTNSATAFQVQNTSNAAALSVDTTTQRVGINNSAPGAALEVTGDIYLTKEAARVIKVDASTTASTAGGSLTLAGGTGNAAVGGAVNINGGTAINSVGGGGGVNIIAGNAASGSVNAGGSVVINSGVGVTAGAITLQTANFSSTFGATNINTGGGKVLIGSANNGFQVDTGQNINTNGTNIAANALATPVISTVSSGSNFYYGVTAVNGQGETVLSNTVGMASSSATITWAVIPGATSYKVYRNSSNVFTSGSLFRASTANGNTATFTDNGTATTAGLPPTTVTGTKLTVQGWASQTGDLQQWQNSAGSALALVDASGNITAARFRSDVWQDTNNNSWASITGTTPSRTLAFGNASISTISITPKSGGDIQLAGATKVNSTGTAGTVEKFRVNTPTTVDNLASSILSADAATSKGLVIQGAASQSADLQQWQNSAGTVLGSVSAAGNFAAGTINTNTFGASALTFSGANPVISASTTNTGLTVQANGTGTLTLNSSGAGTVNVGTTNTTTVGIGNSTAATAVTIQGGTGSSAVSIQSGSGGTVRVGDGGVAGTVQIGNTTGAVTQTVNIGTNPTASSQTNVTIGSTIGASATTIISGTGNLSLQTQGTGNLNVGANAVAQNIVIGNSTGGTNVSINCGTGTCGLGTNAVDHSTTVGSTTGTSLTTIQGGTGGISLNGAISTSGAINGVTLAASALTFSGANPVISASTTNTGVTLQSNGTGTLTLNSSGAGTVNVGTTNTTTIGIGNSTAATTVTSTGGATVQTVANTGVTVKTNTNSISALQVKDTSNNVVFNVDTTTGEVGTVSTSTASTASRALLLQSGATTGTTSNSGDVTLQSGAASTSGNSGALALKTGDAGVGNSGAISLDVGTASSGTVGAITIGTVNARSTTIGNTSSGSSTVINGGTGVAGVSIQSAASGGISIGTTANTSILFGTGAVGGTIKIGGTTQTGTITIGQSTASNIIEIGGGTTGASNVQTVNIANGTGAGTATNVNILSGAGTAGTGTLSLGNNSRVTQIDLGNVAAAAARAINIGTGANTVGVDTINIGTGSTSVAGGKAIHIGDTAPSGSGTNLITLGSTVNASTTTIQGGSGASAITLTQGTGGGIVIGGTGAASTVAIQCGAGTATTCGFANNATDHSTYVGSGTGVSVTTIQGGSGGVVINSNTAINGTINSNTFDASTLTFSGANPVISASTTNTGMTVQANGTGTLTLNSSGAGTVNVGTTNTTTVGIGNNTAATTTTITGGTGANAVSIQTGTGGTISLGTTGIAGTIQIGTTTAVATQTIGIGNNATPSSVNNIAIGNLLTTSNTLIQGGTGANAIQLNQGTGGTITIGGAGAASTVSVLCGAGTANTCGFANNATDHSTYLGSTNGVSATTIQSGTAGISLNGNVSTTGTLVTSGTINTNTLSASALTFSGASPIISTSSTNSGMTLQANGTGTLTLNTTGSGTVNVGTANTTTVAAGNSGASTTVVLTGGATNTTVANAGTTVKTSTNSTTAFQVQNSAGAAILSVNTSTPQVAFTATAVNAVNGTPLVSTSYTNTSTTAGTETAQSITLSDTGVVTSGTDTTNGINLSVTHTGQTGGTIASNGINLQVTMDNGGSATSTGNGIYSLVSGSADTGTGVGGGFLASGSANTTTATGVQGSVGSLFFTGTVANAIGIGSSINATGGVGSFTNAYGIQVATATVGGGGSIGANYGIQVQPQTVGTTNYGIAIGTASTQTLQVGYDADGTTANAGISFGLTALTAANLYRGGDNQLKTDSSLLVKTNTNSTSALSVQTSGGVNVFAVDTVNSTVGTVKTTTASTNSQALTLQSGTVVGTGSSSGNTTLQSGASTVSGNTGTVSVTSGNATSGNSGSVSVDVGTASGTRGSLNLGATNAQNINVGNTTGSTAVSIMGGSGGIAAKATGTTAFQVQNASGVSVLTVDTTNRQLKVMENGGTTNYALIYYDTATSTANYTANSGTVAVGTGAGAISVQAGAGSGITITSNAAALWSTTVGTLTLQSGTNSNLVLTASGTGLVNISNSSKLVLGQSAGDPATCTVGAIVYNTTSRTLRGCQGLTPTWNDLINVTVPTTQATYTASTGGTTPEVKLDTTRGAFDIQGDNAGAVTDLFDVRAGTASGLGQALFSVASSGDTTIQSSAGITELTTTSTDVSIGQGSTAHSTNPIMLVLDNYQPITGSAATEQDGAMYYNADQNVFMCGVGGQWTNCAINSIQSSYVFEDEFLGGTTSAATGTSFQGVGALGWNVNATTSCAAAYNQTGPTLTHDHPGTLRLTTGGASGNGCALTQAGTAAGTATLSQIIGAGDVFKTNVAIGAQTGTMRVGWTNQTSNTAPTSGAWWEYVNASDATHLRYCYANNGGATCAAGPVIAANTWAELEIYINSSSNITFVTNINGTPTSVTTTSAFDTGATNKLGPTSTCYASSATPLNCYVDYIQWSGVNTSTHGVRD